MSDKNVSDMSDAEIRAMAGAESPADLMRRAAALLTEYIAAASPANWQHMCLGSEGCQVLNDGHLRERKHVARFGRKEWKADHADAVYVAAMGPQVGSPLADWLEATAIDADEFVKQDTPECGHEDDTLPCRCDRSPVWGCDRCGEFMAPGACSCWEKALAVARAVLDGAR